MAGQVHIGVGGWDYDPWRGTFYPDKLARKKQLGFAAERLTATEVNATFYKLQKPETWAEWAKAVPDGFRFAIKGSRFCTNRKQLGEAAEAIGRFCGQGFTELGDKLGPINWQLMPTKRFDDAEISAFFGLLPTSRDGLTLRHAIEPRHESFRCREFVALAQAAGVAIVVADSDDYPQIADLTTDFVYARLQRTCEEEALGYGTSDLDRWAGVIRGWAQGQSPDGLDYAGDPRANAETGPRDVYAFVISGHKVRNPAAAQALIERVGLKD